MFISLEKFCSKMRLAKLRFDVPVLHSIFLQMAKGLGYLQELGFLHRDPKPENFLVTEELDVKVADFGVTRFCSDDEMTPEQGTEKFWPPECWTGYYDKSRDVWSAGITFGDIIMKTNTTVPKFDPATLPTNKEELFGQLEEEDLSVVRNLSNGINLMILKQIATVRNEMLLAVRHVEAPWLERLVIRTLHINPRKRPTFKEIVEELETCSQAEVMEDHPLRKYNWNVRAQM